jgi:hypothetical protein
MILEQIKEAAGRQPIDVAVQHNLARLDQWLEVWYQQRGNDIGSTDVLAQDQQKENGSPMNGFSGQD